MGDLRPDTGGVPPEDGSGGASDGLPDLPPEWGTVIIPDDASELDHEAAALRRELRRTHRQTRLRGPRSAPPAGTEPSPSLGIPLVIMAVAVLTTLVSLFVVTWGRPAPAAHPGGRGQRADGPVHGERRRSPMSSWSTRVACAYAWARCCPRCCSSSTDVTASSSCWPPPPSLRSGSGSSRWPGPRRHCSERRPNVRPLADPDGILRARYANGTAIGPSSATALLVDGTGEITSVVAIVRTIDDIRAPLLTLGP